MPVEVDLPFVRFHLRECGEGLVEVEECLAHRFDVVDDIHIFVRAGCENADGDERNCDHHTDADVSLTSFRDQDLSPLVCASSTLEAHVVEQVAELSERAARETLGRARHPLEEFELSSSELFDGSVIEHDVIDDTTVFRACCAVLLAKDCNGCCAVAFTHFELCNVGARESFDFHSFTSYPIGLLLVSDWSFVKGAG